jgi:ATP-binding cassette subfamily F protein 3
MRSKDVLKKAIKDFDGTAIVVSHDREFLDGLVDKVYEFGNQRVVEHLGGIYNFLEKKKMDSLKELEIANPVQNTVQNTKPADNQDTTSKLTYEERKELSRQIKRIEKQISEMEQQIENKESEIAGIESKLTTPEGAADASLFEKHGQLNKELKDDMSKWEELTMELEKMMNT